MEEFWDAVLDIKGRRVAVDIQTAEQIGEGGTGHVWLTSAKARTQFAQAVMWRVRQDKIKTFFWVWSEDVSNEPGMIELFKLLRAASLPDTDLVLLHGDPAAVARAGADGVIIGSKIVGMIESNLGDTEKTLAEISTFLGQVKNAI